MLVDDDDDDVDGDGDADAGDVMMVKVLIVGSI